MHIVILGAGRIGFQLARQLISENHSVALLEKDRKRAEDVTSRLDCLVINETGTNIEKLKTADIQKADFFVAVTNSDEINMFTCGLVSSEFDKPQTIARVRNLDYHRSRFLRLSTLGINHVINPEVEAAKSINRAIEYGGQSDIILLENSSFQIRNISIKPDSPFRSRTLKQVKMRLSFDFLITAIIRDSEYIIPTGDSMLMENDEIFIMAREENFKDLFPKKEGSKDEVSNILIIGCGNIGSYLVDFLLNRESEKNNNIPKFFQRIKGLLRAPLLKKIHIMDRDISRCKHLAEIYPEALVSNGDITDESALSPKIAAKTDLIITTTGNEELNLITAIYAKTLGISKSVALVTQKSYRDMGSSLGVDVTISLNNNMVNTILKIVRKDTMRNIHTIADGTIEVIEYKINQTSKLAGKSIAELKLPKDCLIIIISREGNESIPSGSFVIRGYDQIVLISARESINKLDSIFSS